LIYLLYRYGWLDFSIICSIYQFTRLYRDSRVYLKAGVEAASDQVVVVVCKIVIFLIYLKGIILSAHDTYEHICGQYAFCF